MPNSIERDRQIAEVAARIVDAYANGDVAIKTYLGNGRWPAPSSVRAVVDPEQGDAISLPEYDKIRQVANLGAALIEIGSAVSLYATTALAKVTGQKATA